MWLPRAVTNSDTHGKGWGDVQRQRCSSRSVAQDMTSHLFISAVFGTNYCVFIYFRPRMDASVSTRPYTFCATSIGYVVGQDDGQREWARNAGMRFLITNRLMRGRGVVFFIIAENAFMRMYEARSISVGPQNFSALLQLWLLFAWVCAILYGGYRGAVWFWKPSRDSVLPSRCGGNIVTAQRQFLGGC